MVTTSFYFIRATYALFKLVSMTKAAIDEQKSSKVEDEASHRHQREGKQQESLLGHNRPLTNNVSAKI